MGAHIEQLPPVLWLWRSIPFMFKSDTNLTRPSSLSTNLLPFRPLEQWQIVHARLDWMVAALAHTLRLSIWKCTCIFSPT